MSVDPPPVEVLPAEQLREAAVRLTADLDLARMHQAAAYVSMAVVAMAKDPDGAAKDRKYRSDVECEFELDEHDRVWMYRDGDCHIIGRKNYIRTEMWRFLRVLLSKPL
jgi:hypothetical protein